MPMAVLPSSAMAVETLPSLPCSSGPKSSTSAADIDLEAGCLCLRLVVSRSEGRLLSGCLWQLACCALLWLHVCGGFDSSTSILQYRARRKQGAMSALGSYIETGDTLSHRYKVLPLRAAARSTPERGGVGHRSRSSYY